VAVVVLGAAWAGASPGGASPDAAPSPGGGISGRVLDDAGAPLPGVTVTAQREGGKGTPRATYTGADGLFVLPNLPPGGYTIRAYLPGFEAAVAEASLLGDQLITLEIQLRTAQFSGTVEVTSEAPRHSSVELLEKRHQAATVTDSISSEDMGKSADSDAAEVVEHLIGVSVVDEKYVFVRGLGERYSHVTLNGALIPTTEPEKRVVPLDLFPAELLEAVEVSKTYTPDRAGEFAGGDVDLSTLEFPRSPTLRVSLGVSHTQGTTGKRFEQYGGGLDWLGGGGQPQPSDLPPERLTRRSFVNPEGLTPEELEAIGRSFGRVWSPRVENSAPLNGKASFSYGNTFGDKLGVVISGVTSHSYQHVGDEIQNFFGLDAGELVPRNDYRLRTDTERVRNGILGSVGYRFNANNRLTWTSLFTRNASAASRFQQGYNSNDGNNIRDFRLEYGREDVFANRLAGEHNFTGVGAGSELLWSVGYSQASRDFDLRENLYHEISPDVYWLNVGAPESGKIEYHTLDEDLFEANGSWATFFAKGDSSYGSVKVGVAYSDRNRDFVARRFRFITRNPSQFDLTLPPEELFIPDNIRPDGWEVLEQTGLNDAYTGSHTVAALFAMADWTWDRWRFIGGARVENSRQEVVTTNPFDTSNPVASKLDDTDLLPALNVVYRISSASNLRLAASRTVNRPEFRELSPFNFVEVTGGRSIAGNPDLKRAAISSLDVRWETFPAAGEVMALSGFYKEITDPIERIVQPTTELRTSFMNADSATLYGAEIEFRRSLALLSPLLRRWTLNLNYTYTHSDVTIPRDSLSASTNQNRPLEGQSKHIGNASVEFLLPEWGTTVRVLFNYTGRRITDVGAFGLPDITQSPERGLDVVVAQSLDRLFPGLAVKFTGGNLLDSRREFVQGGQIQQSFTLGRTYSLSFSYTFNPGDA